MELAIQIWLSLAVGFVVTSVVAGTLSEVVHKVHKWQGSVGHGNHWRHP